MHIYKKIPKQSSELKISIDETIDPDSFSCGPVLLFSKEDCSYKLNISSLKDIRDICNLNASLEMLYFVVSDLKKQGATLAKEDEYQIYCIIEAFRHLPFNQAKARLCIVS